MKVIENHQDVLQFNVKLHENLLYRDARVIHVREWLDKENLPVLPHNGRLKLAPPGSKSNPEIPGNRVDDRKSDIVTAPVVF
jgi:hypothetical protein